MSRERILDNPFYVLGLRPEASRADVEREGQKLLAMLEIGMAGAKTYPTPLGPAPRTADKVRQSLAELRDPQRRLLHELWAHLPPSPVEPAVPPVTKAAAAPSSAERPDEAAGDAGDEPAPWPEALAALGLAPPGPRS